MKTLPVLLALALCACGPAPCPEPFFDGKGSDEAWRSMVDAEARAKKDDAKAVALSFPTEAAALSAATVPTFAWTTPLTASVRLSPRRPSMLSRLGGLVYGTAWAHLPPVTGPTHLLRISVPKKQCPLEVLTTKTEWIPTAEQWAQLKDTGNQTLSFDVFSAYLQENRITEGPFHFSRPLTFTVSQ